MNGVRSKSTITINSALGKRLKSLPSAEKTSNTSTVHKCQFQEDHAAQKRTPNKLNTLKDVDISAK